ncbi:head-tail connector protein [Rhodovulum sp. DZ06]|uniref:head-tail connector protein n=1 Tax=Rhodovulum sp. DZ06 TaxID=3425126 RepID=UPI003D32D13C
MLTELEEAPVAPVAAADLAAHLRLNTGLAPLDAEEVAALDGFARAAGAAVEAYTGRALIRRRFKWTVERWRDACREVLPIAPVVQVNAVTMVAADGGWESVDPSRWRLVQDTFAPALAGAGSGWLPSIPTAGVAEVEVLAGHADDGAGLPHDLRQAVTLLAAHYHEQRHAAGGRMDEIPHGVAALLMRWRKVRL